MTPFKTVHVKSAGNLNIKQLYSFQKNPGRYSNTHTHLFLVETAWTASRDLSIKAL